MGRGIASCCCPGSPSSGVLGGVASGHAWDGHRLVVMEIMGRCLAGVLATRGGMPGLGCSAPGGVLATAQVGPGVAPGQAGGVGHDVACQCCQLRVAKRHNQMLLCDGCPRGYHMHCLRPPLATVPDGDWLCPGCTVQVAHGAHSCPPAPRAHEPADDGQACVVCCDPRDGGMMLLCDDCGCGYHWYCVGENRRRVPRGAWRCPGCRPGRTLSAQRGARAHGACATAGAQ